MSSTKPKKVRSSKAACSWVPPCSATPGPAQQPQALIRLWALGYVATRPDAPRSLEPTAPVPGGRAGELWRCHDGTLDIPGGVAACAWLLNAKKCMLPVKSAESALWIVGASWGFRA